MSHVDEENERFLFHIEEYISKDNKNKMELRNNLRSKFPDTPLSLCMFDQLHVQISVSVAKGLGMQKWRDEQISVHDAFTAPNPYAKSNPENTEQKYDWARKKVKVNVGNIRFFLFKSALAENLSPGCNCNDSTVNILPGTGMTTVSHNLPRDPTTTVAQSSPTTSSPGTEGTTDIHNHQQQQQTTQSKGKSIKSVLIKRIENSLTSSGVAVDVINQAIQSIKHVFKRFNLGDVKKKLFDKKNVSYGDGQEEEEFDENNTLKVSSTKTSSSNKGATPEGEEDEDDEYDDYDDDDDDDDDDGVNAAPGSGSGGIGSEPRGSVVPVGGSRGSAVPVASAKAKEATVKAKIPKLEAFIYVIISALLNMVKVGKSSATRAHMDAIRYREIGRPNRMLIYDVPRDLVNDPNDTLLTKIEKAILKRLDSIGYVMYEAGEYLYLYEVGCETSLVMTYDRIIREVIASFDPNLRHLNATALKRSAQTSLLNTSPPWFGPEGLNNPFLLMSQTKAFIEKVIKFAPDLAKAYGAEVILRGIRGLEELGIAAQFNPENRPPFSSMDRKARRRQDAGIAVYPDDKDSKDETSGTVLKLKSEVQGEHDITVTFTSNEAITRMDGVFRTDSTIGWRILYYASTGIKDVDYTDFTSVGDMINWTTLVRANIRLNKDEITAEEKTMLIATVDGFFGWLEERHTMLDQEQWDDLSDPPDGIALHDDAIGKHYLILKFIPLEKGVVIWEQQENGTSFRLVRDCQTSLVTRPYKETDLKRILKYDVMLYKPHFTRATGSPSHTKLSYFESSKSFHTMFMDASSRMKTAWIALVDSTPAPAPTSTSNAVSSPGTTDSIINSQEDSMDVDDYNGSDVSPLAKATTTTTTSTTSNRRALVRPGSSSRLSPAVGSPSAAPSQRAVISSKAGRVRRLNDNLFEGDPDGKVDVNDDSSADEEDDERIEAKGRFFELIAGDCVDGLTPDLKLSINLLCTYEDLNIFQHYKNLTNVPETEAEAADAVATTIAYEQLCVEDDARVKSVRNGGKKRQGEKVLESMFEMQAGQSGSDHDGDESDGDVDSNHQLTGQLTQFIKAKARSNGILKKAWQEKMAASSRQLEQTRQQNEREPHHMFQSITNVVQEAVRDPDLHLTGFYSPDGISQPFPPRMYFAKKHEKSKASKVLVNCKGVKMPMSCRGVPVPVLSESSRKFTIKYYATGTGSKEKTFFIVYNSLHQRMDVEVCVDGNPTKFIASLKISKFIVRSREVAIAILRAICYVFAGPYNCTLKYEINPKSIFNLTEDELEPRILRSIGFTKGFDKHLNFVIDARDFCMRTSSDDKNKIDKIWDKGGKNKDEDVVAENLASSINRSDFRRMKTSGSLNAECIILYLYMLKAWSQQFSIIDNDIHNCNILLHDGIESHDDAYIGRYEKDINVFEFKKVLFPIHKPNHWILAVAFMEDRIIRCYDSYKSSDSANENNIKHVLYFLNRKKMINKNDDDRVWRIEHMPCPQQINGVDCGIFVLLFAICVACGVDVNIINVRDTITRWRYKLASDMLLPQLDRNILPDYMIDNDKFSLVAACVIVNNESDRVPGSKRRSIITDEDDDDDGVVYGYDVSVPDACAMTEGGEGELSTRPAQVVGDEEVNGPISATTISPGAGAVTISPSIIMPSLRKLHHNITVSAPQLEPLMVSASSKGSKRLNRAAVTPSAEVEEPHNVISPKLAIAPDPMIAPTRGRKKANITVTTPLHEVTITPTPATVPSLLDGKILHCATTSTTALVHVTKSPTVSTPSLGGEVTDTIVTAPHSAALTVQAHSSSRKRLSTAITTSPADAEELHKPAAVPDPTIAPSRGRTRSNATGATAVPTTVTRAASKGNKTAQESTAKKRRKT